MHDNSRRAVLSVATVVVVFACLAGCDSGSDGPNLTPEQKAGATAVCQKLASCEGFEYSSSEMSECVIEGVLALQLFPDPDQFAECINSMSCSEIEEIALSQILACLDTNRDSYVCTDSTTLTGCSNSGKCASISCPDFCRLDGLKFHHCGASSDPEKLANVCWCEET